MYEQDLDSLMPVLVDQLPPPLLVKPYAERERVVRCLATTVEQTQQALLEYYLPDPASNIQRYCDSLRRADIPLRVANVLGVVDTLAKALMVYTF